jgi:hypothetical protein
MLEPNAISELTQIAGDDDGTEHGDIVGDEVMDGNDDGILDGNWDGDGKTI